MKSEKYKGLPRGEALITAEELHEKISRGEKKLVVIAVAGFFDFFKEHIPMARRVWRADYEAPKSKYNFTGMLCDSKKFSKLLSQLGVSEDSEIVLYDYKYDSTRFWWALYKYGIKNARILDGGFDSWKAKNYKTETFKLSKKYKAPLMSLKGSQSLMTVTMSDVQKASRGDKSFQLWDTRDPSEWSGKKKLSGAFRKGRIPNATFLIWKNFRYKEKVEFKSYEDLKRVCESFNIDKTKKQIFYCQSGVRTTQAIFALYLLGWPIENLLNYDGSWIEWSYYKENPVETD